MKKEIRMESDVHVKNPLVLDDLYSAFRAADQIVLKKYLYKLSDSSCLEMDRDLQSIKVGGNVSLYRVAQIVYDKNENIQDKLTTVYSSILSLGNYGIVMCANYEDLYSQLVPFKTSSQTLNVQKSSTDTNGIIKGVTNTTNESIAKSLSHGTSVSKTHTNSVGGGGSVGLKFVGAMASYAHATSNTNTKTTADINTKSSGTAKSLTEQNSVAKSLSTTNGESIQLNYENRAVKTLLERIDEQIKRMRTCEDFGMFDTCAYFAAKDYNVAVAAASAFKSLTRGDNSSVEASYVNVWKKEEDIKLMKEYLMRLYHPEFLSIVDENHSYRTTAAMLISGKEMAYKWNSTN